eukprot:TRINITY_DN2809_c0_g1_i1.p1 TRINITY_DN2809_c0_g1~~TRINITY_DN2809_c0_g1_i1.p1  ORF type:complete len:214 (+),score=44.30 TRINITY_DN2809_c0_g1_i1:49-642(+)
MYSFLYGAVRDMFRYFGFLESKKGKVLFLGLDNAGKTSLLSVVSSGKVVAPKPTAHPTNESFKVGGVRINAYDLGGHDNGRLLWESYFTKADGIMFLVDAADYTRLDLVKTELDKILMDPSLSKTPLCIIGNKIDITTALSQQQLEAVLGLDGLLTGKNPEKTPPMTRPVEVFMASVTRGFGYGEAIKWLAFFLSDS